MPTRFVTLDALRGVAALVVVFVHTWTFGPWIPRFGYLSVDIFFLLSGFVLGYQYEPRFRAGMTFQQFALARIIRLYPLYLFGLVLGVTIAVLLSTSLTARDIAIAAVANLLMLPTSALPRDLAIFPLNGPFWSLFFEFWVANLLFGLLRNHLSTKVLFGLIGLSAVYLLITEAIFHSLNDGVIWFNFVGGFGRVTFSFFTGMALARYQKKTFSLPAWAPVVALPLLLSVPIEGRIAHLYELACVLFAFPALIYLSSQAKERRPWIGNALGDASYALYTIHYPLLSLIPIIVKAFGFSAGLPLQLGFVAITAVMGWLLSFADTRLRVWLKVRLLPRRQQIGNHIALQTSQS